MDGLKPKKEAGARAAGRKVPTLIGHLADYDRSGGDIADAVAEDALAFALWHRDYNGAPGSLFVQRIGLTRAQALKHELLDTDGKAELDGLPVPALEQAESFLRAACAERTVLTSPGCHFSCGRRAEKHNRALEVAKGA